MGPGGVSGIILTLLPLGTPLAVLYLLVGEGVAMFAGELLGLTADSRGGGIEMPA